MESKILEIINQLLTHEINKKEAVKSLLFLSVTNSNAPNIQAALNESVSVYRFADSSDYRSGLYRVIENLSGIKNLNDDDIRTLFDQLNPEENDN